MTAQATGRFYRVRDILDAFKQVGCEVRVAEPTILSEDGDCWNVRYVVDPSTKRFVPVQDLADDEFIAEWEVRYYERRLGITIPRPSSLSHLSPN